MAYVFSTNLSPSTDAEAMFLFKEFMKSANWTVVASGDGQAIFSLSGDVIDHFGTGPNGMSNSTYKGTTTTIIGGHVTTIDVYHGAWFILKMPGQEKYFSFQRSNDPYNPNTNYGTTLIPAAQWRVKYSIHEYDLTTNASATVVPSVSSSHDTDRIILGGGTDSLGIFSDLFLGRNAFRMHIVADNANPSGFCFFTYKKGFGGFAIETIFMYDPLVANTYPVNEIDPYVIYVDYINNTFDINGFPTKVSVCDLSRLSNPKTSVSGYLGLTASSDNFVKLAATCYAGGNPQITSDTGYIQLNSYIPNMLTSNIYTNFDDIMHILYAKSFFYNPAAPSGYKGYSSMMKWMSTRRGNLTLLSSLTSENRIVLGDISIPWNGSSPII